MRVFEGAVWKRFFSTRAAFQLGIRSCLRSFLPAFVSNLREDVNKTTRNLFPEANRCRLPSWETHVYPAARSLSCGNTHAPVFFLPREYVNLAASRRPFVTAMLWNFTQCHPVSAPRFRYWKPWSKKKKKKEEKGKKSIPARFPPIFWIFVKQITRFSLVLLFWTDLDDGRCRCYSLLIGRVIEYLTRVNFLLSWKKFLLTLVSDLGIGMYLFICVRDETHDKKYMLFCIRGEYESYAANWRCLLLYRSREFQVVLKSSFVRFNDGKNVNIIEGIRH